MVTIAATHGRLHLVLLVATSTLDLATSLITTRSNVNALMPGSGRACNIVDSRPVAVTALHVHPHDRPRDSNWEDDTKSSRTNVDVTGYVPPWRDHQGQQAFSGSQAMPGGKGRPFQKFSAATPQETVSPTGLPPQNNVPQLAELAQQAATGQQIQVVAAPVRRGGGNSAVGGVGGSGGLLHGIKWPLTQDPPGVVAEHPLLVARTAITVLSTLATWYLHLFKDHSPVLASSAVTLLVSACVDRRLGTAALCGCLAGTCGGHLAPTPAAAALLGALASVSYEVLIHINDFCRGVGGRAGAAAFVATSAMAWYRKVGGAGRKMRRGLWSGAGPSSLLVAMVAYHALGAVATILLRECSDDAGAADPVRASSVVGLLGALLLKDPTALLALHGGSFVGMSLPSRLLFGNLPTGKRQPHERTSAVALVGSFLGAGALAGLFHAATVHRGLWNGGWGGKAGLCAFVGCWAYRGLGNAWGFFKRKQR